MDRRPCEKSDRGISFNRDQYITLEGAFDKNAKLIALKAISYPTSAPIRAFSTTCGVEPLMAMAEMPGPYDVQQPIECVARGVDHQHLHRWRPIAACRGRSSPSRWNG